MDNFRSPTLRFHNLTLARAAHLIAVAECLGNKHWTVEGAEELELQLMAELEMSRMTGNRKPPSRRSMRRHKSKVRA